MSNEVILAIMLTIIPSLGLGAIIVAIFNHYAGKKKEIEQHQRERKEDQYKKLLDKLTGFFEGTINEDKKKEFMLELSTNAMLFASSKVIRTANEFLEAFIGENKLSATERDKLSNKLVLAIRDEMGVDKKDKLNVEEAKRYKLN